MGKLRTEWKFKDKVRHLRTGRKIEDKAKKVKDRVNKIMTEWEY